MTPRRLSPIALAGTFARPTLVVVAAFAVALTPPALTAQVPAGGEFQVNTYTTAWQSFPSLASDAAGNFVVAWSSYGQDGSSDGVFAQRYDASGARLGAEFQVNTYTTYSQSFPSLASDAAGNLVVAWYSYRQDGSIGGVFAQRYGATGTRRGSEFQVNTYTTASQYPPSVASDAAGNFVVVWPGLGQDGWGVFAQRFDASGARRGAEFQVITHTAASQSYPSLASDAAGDFVVVWQSSDQDGSIWGVFAQRYDAAGAPRGSEFQVNTHTASSQSYPSLASDAAGNFVVAWSSSGQDGSYNGIFAQRYDASGARRGAEFQVNTYTTYSQSFPSLASDAAGDFVVAWESRGPDSSHNGIFAQRYDAAGVRRGAEFQVNTDTTNRQSWPFVASDASGNFVVAWGSRDQGSSYSDIFAQRYGGLQPTAVSVDPSALVLADGNGVFEPGESVRVAPSWKNVNGQTLSFDGGLLSFTGPTGTGVTYSVQQALARYGTVANGETVACSDCFQVGVDLAGPRPATHWDATLTERISPDALGQTKPWSLHVGMSFSDLPKTSPFYPFVERILHRGVTGGCSATTYCPANPVTREQAAVFTLAGKEGALYSPQACSTPPFADVPASSPFCRHIAELARRGVVSGCGSGNYCPSDPVTREQMPVFVLRVLDPVLTPPPCGTPVFNDVPASSPYCAWIEELARRGVVSGCGAGNYCPADPVTREQMAVFVAVAFGLTLYGP